MYFSGQERQQRKKELRESKHEEASMGEQEGKDYPQMLLFIRHLQTKFVFVQSGKDWKGIRMQCGMCVEK